MKELLRIESDRARLVLRDTGGPFPALVPGSPSPGQALITPRRPGLESLNIAVNGQPTTLPAAPFRLFEQRDYSIYACVAGHAQSVKLVHRDPNITLMFNSEDGSRSTFGRVNFRSQIGRTTFALFIDGRPEFDVELEVFPTKLDYATDYERLLADVQGVLTGLAFEYLRATFQLGLPFSAPRPTELEWLLLLRNVVGELEKALRFIASRPIRGLTREPRLVHASRVRRVDSAVRTAVRRGRGSGPFLGLGNHVPVRSLLEEQRARPTLDTPEHRWLAEQIRQCRRKVGKLLRDELSGSSTQRRKHIIAELEGIESKLSVLSKLEPLAAAEDPPPPGFASLQLIGAPGYREAYRQCIVLTLGLRIEGGPFNLSVKDLSELYEYWCYLAVLQLIAEATGSRITPADLVSIQQTGLRVRLERGRATRVRFKQNDEREVRVTYSPRFGGRDMLIPQKPDILVTFLERNWPEMHLVLDAKYRIDNSPEYVQDNDTPGPPQDALNVLHRYRDAIFDHDSSDDRPRHSVIEAVALFPSSPDPNQFKHSRLWRAIGRIGVGAIPALPDNLELLREWLRGALARGGWALSDRAPRHAAVESSHDWRHAAALPVLIGVLRGDGPQEHLDWICKTQVYYLPRSETQTRQFQTAKVAIYSPAALRGRGEPGAVTHVADVLGIDLVTRRQIETPWDSSDPDQLQVYYRLGPIEALTEPILNRDQTGRGQRVSTSRWSSLLALKRARELRELLLETEPEWRLLEALRARGASFSFDPLRPGLVSAENPHGRTWFEVGPRRVRYAGTSGFILESDGRREREFADLTQACDYLTLTAVGMTPHT